MRYIICILTCFIGITSASYSFAESASQQQRIKLLKQLDILDKSDIRDLLESAKICANREDFDCVNDKIKAAKLLIVDGEDSKAIAEVRSYADSRMTARDDRLRREAEARSRAEEAAKGKVFNYKGKEIRYKFSGLSGDLSSSKIISNEDGINMFATCMLAAKPYTSIGTIDFTYVASRGDRIVMRANITYTVWALLFSSTYTKDWRVEIVDNIDTYRCVSAEMM